MISETKYL